MRCSPGAGRRGLDLVRHLPAAVGNRRERVGAAGRVRIGGAVELAAAISVELYVAGREGRDPDPIVAEHRDKIRHLGAALADLQRAEAGAEAAIIDAENAVAVVRLTGAPAFQDALLEQSATLAEERARLEAELARRAGQEQDLRGSWRELAAAVPRADDPPFAEGVHVPTRRRCDPHPGIVAFTPHDWWSGWFTQVQRAAIDEYGGPEQ